MQVEHLDWSSRRSVSYESEPFFGTSVTVLLTIIARFFHIARSLLDPQRDSGLENVFDLGKHFWHWRRAVIIDSTTGPCTRWKKGMDTTDLPGVIVASRAKVTRVCSAPLMVRYVVWNESATGGSHWDAKASTSCSCYGLYAAARRLLGDLNALIIGTTELCPLI